MGAAGREERKRFEQEALPHLDALFSAALYMTRNEEEASNLCQETMLRAYGFFDSLAAGSNYRAWLLTNLHNLWRTRHSRLRHDGLSASDEDFQPAMDIESLRREDPSGNPETRFIRRAAGRPVHDVLHMLPEDFKVAVILVDLEDLTYEEAGKALAVPIGTIRSRVSRARTLIRKALDSVAGMRNTARPLK